MSIQENRFEKFKHYLKAKRKAIIHWGYPKESESLEKAAHIGIKTRSPCSCAMCKPHKFMKQSQIDRPKDKVEKINLKENLE